VVDLIIPVLMNPEGVPPATCTFVQDCQRLPNAVFWRIVAEVCDSCWEHGAAFSVWTEIQRQLEVLPELRDICRDNQAHWGLRQAHRVFVDAVPIRVRRV
jgi:hypothetical protein